MLRQAADLQPRRLSLQHEPAPKLLLPASSARTRKATGSSRDSKSEGVDTSAVIRDPQVNTGASVIVVSKATESRAIVTRPVPPVHFPAGARFHELLRTADWVHVDHLGWNAIANSTGLRISVDAGNPIPSFSPQGVELYVPTIERLLAEYGADLKPEVLVQRGQ